LSEKKNEIKDLIDILLSNKVEGRNFSDEEIIAHAKTFLGAGHETTATLCCWIFYVLVKHHSVYDKIKSEVNSVLTNKSHNANKLEFDDLKKLKYLDCVIKETLRMYPSVPMVMRNAKESRKYGEFIIPKGVTVIVAPYLLHHDPKVWDEPEVFKPERWLVKQKMHSNQYIPFLFGPRDCIGKRFALMEAKVIVALLVREFKFEMKDEDYNAVKRKSFVTMKPSALPMYISSC